MRGQEKAAARQQGQRDSQLENKRQSGGEVSADKRRRSVEGSRGSGGAMRGGGGGVTRGVMATIRQTRGMRGGGASGQRGGGVLNAGGDSRH